MRGMHKFVATALTAAAVVVALPSAAQASVPSVKLRICNDTSRALWVSIEGLNQDSQPSQYIFDDLFRPGACETANGYWWAAIDQNAEIHWWTEGSSISKYTNYTVQSNFPNGSTQTHRITTL
ncbi:hypothetical protein [Streptomyces lincolnensis]|uniref:hypothetical protein n=1 Tax=Streptomyces lincolnensis TaxID=1915 RepID=UPI0037D79DCA